MDDSQTVITTFEVNPGTCADLLDELRDAYASFISHQPGFVSARLHVNDAQTRIANVSHWRRREDFLVEPGLVHVERVERVVGDLARDAAVALHLGEVARAAEDSVTSGTSAALITARIGEASAGVQGRRGRPARPRDAVSHEASGCGSPAGALTASGASLALAAGRVREAGARVLGRRGRPARRRRRLSWNDRLWQPCRCLHDERREPVLAAGR